MNAFSLIYKYYIICPYSREYHVSCSYKYYIIFRVLYNSPLFPKWCIISVIDTPHWEKNDVYLVNRGCMYSVVFIAIGGSRGVMGEMSIKVGPCPPQYYRSALPIVVPLIPKCVFNKQQVFMYCCYICDSK